MHLFDMRTLSLVNAVGAILVAGLMFFLWYYVSREYGLGQWVAGAIVLAVGSVLLLLRDIAPDWVSVVMGNGVCLLGAGYMMAGARRFSGLRDGFPWHWAAAATGAVFAWYFVTIMPNLTMRVTAYSVLTAWIAGRAGLALWQNAVNGRFGAGQRFTACNFFVVTAIMLVRAVGIWFSDPGQDYMLPMNFAVISGALAQLISNAVLVVGVTMMLNNRLQERLTKMSYLDGLTGIGNRRFFDEAYRHELGKLRYDYQVLTAILIDIDFFKEYNDRYGHQKGDECLVLVAKAVETACKSPEVTVARYGGEEFIVLLPGVNVEAAQQAADKINAAVDALDIPHCGSRVENYLTVSQGVATLAGGGEQPLMTLLEAADRCLYEAKHSGRHQWRALDLDAAVIEPGSAMMSIK